MFQMKNMHAHAHKHTRTHILVFLSFIDLKATSLSSNRPLMLWRAAKMASLNKNVFTFLVEWIFWWAVCSKYKNTHKGFHCSAFMPYTRPTSLFNVMPQTLEPVPTVWHCVWRRSQMNGNPARSGCNTKVLLQLTTKRLLLSGMKAAKECLSRRGRCPGAVSGG